MLKLVNNKKGFTLLEATVAILILMVGLLAVINFFPLGLRITGDSRNLTMASNLALAKIEELKALNYDELSTGTIETKQRISTDPTSYLYPYQRQTDIETIDSDFNSSASDVGFKKITVTLFWQSPLLINERSIQINSVVADY
jgi:Tfp pilus assembly protein PilV